MVAGPVLLVEDDELNQALAVAILTRLGYSTEVAASGRAAVETVAPGTYRAVLLDCQPPEMAGYQATAETRRREATARQTPIIAMTAAASREDRERSLAAGMDEHIAKPVSIGEVEAVLACWVRGTAIAPVVSGPADAAVRAGGVVDRDRLAALGGLDLNGAAAILGVKAVIGLCQELQLLARSGALTPARDLVRRLEEEFDRVGSALDAVVPRR